MVDKTLQVIETENNPSEKNLHGEVNAGEQGSLREGTTEMDSQEVFQIEGQILEGEIEIQNGGYIEMTSEMIGGDLESQMQLQMMGEQQLNSVNGEGMTVMMSSQVIDGQQFDMQNGTQFQVINGQQVIAGDSSGQMQMSMLSSGEYGGQTLELEGGDIQGAEIVYGETQVIDMTAQGMNGAELQSQEMALGSNGQMIQVEGMSVGQSGVVTQEISLEMNEQQIQMQEMSMQGMSMQGTTMEGMSMQEISMQGMSMEGMAMQGMSMQEMSMQGTAMEGMSMQEMSMEGMSMEGMVMQGMSMQEMSMQGAAMEGMGMEGMATQEMSMQGMSMDGMATEGMAMQEMSMQGIAMEGMTMQDMSLEMQSQEMQSQEIHEQQLGMSEMTMQEMPLEMSGGEMQTQEMGLEMQSQEISAVEGEYQISMSEMTMQEMPLDMAEGEMTMQEIPLEMQSQEFSAVDGEYQIGMSEMTIQEIPLDMAGGEMSMQETPLEIQNQEISVVDGEYHIGTSEVTVQEIPLDIAGGETQTIAMSMQEMPLEMTAGEMQTQAMSIQEMPLEMQSQGGEMQEQQFGMSEITLQEMPLEMIGVELQTQEMSMQEMPLEMQSQQISVVEGSEIQEQQFEMSEMTVQEMPLKMTGEEIQREEMSMQEMPLEMQNQEISVVEGSNIEDQQFEMSEMTMQEMPLAMQNQEIVLVEGDQIQEQQFETSEMTMQEIPLEMTGEEIQTQEMSIQEMPLEMQNQEIVVVEGDQIQEQQFETSEMTMQEIPLEMTGEEIQTQEMSIQEMPLEMQNQEIVVVEGDQIQEQQFETSEMTMQEIPLEMTREEIQTQEMTVQEMPLEMQSQETSVVVGGEIHEEQAQRTEMTMQEMPLEMTSEIIQTQELSVEEIALEEGKVREDAERHIQEQQLPLEGGAIKEVQLDTGLTQEKQVPVKQKTEEKVLPNIAESNWSVEVIGTVENQDPEQSWSMEVIGTIDEKGTDQSWSIEEVGVIDSNKLTEETASEINSVTESTKMPEFQNPFEKETDKKKPELLVDATKKKEKAKSSEVDKQVDSKETASEQTQGRMFTVTQKETCGHDILIDQFLERISQLEKEKEYLEGRYDELRQEKETLHISSRDQPTTTGDHHHCCDILKDYGSLIEYITTSRDVSLDDHNYEPGCVCSHTCNVHSSAREVGRNSNQISRDYEYFKSKCDQIRREKERLERAYENEKRQKEEFEREYQTKNDEKVYLEERYQGMLENINRFDETIRSLRCDNELLQSKLNEWAKSQVMTHTLDQNMLVSEQEDDGVEITEYKRNIRALEKENREFKSILDVLSKKNESQENLKNIELGLVRENEFIELNRERVRLESSIREMKRTNKHQQDRIEEIRRESATELSRLKDKIRKLERSLKDNEKTFEEKEDEIANLKKRHSEELQAIEMRLQTQISNTVHAKNQHKDLQSKVERLEEERCRLREELRNSSLSGRDRYAGIEAENQDIEVVRQRYEDERRSKLRLASDIKYLLADIMDLKERNQKLQEDFTRERMEIKAMIEKQANDITQEYLTQINKLQRSLLEETKRRQEAEAGTGGPLRNQENYSSFIGGQTEGTARSGWGNNDFQVQLANEIRRRETLEVENKKLLYKLNDIFSGGGNTNDDETSDTVNYKGISLNKNETNNVGSSRSNQESVKKQKELQAEIEDLKDKAEALRNETKRNKELKRKKEDLEEEVTHVTRKRDELLAAQRNLTREVDHLSRTLDDVERRNRKLSDETERFTRKIQDIEDSFRKEKITLTRNHENEKSKAVEEVMKMKEACEKRLQVQTDITWRLEEKIQRLEEQIPLKAVTHSRGLNTSFPSHNGVSEDLRSRATHFQDDKVKQEVENLEAMLKDVNKKHADDLKNLEAQKRRMSEEFEREKQSLEKYFEEENSSLKQRLRDVESSIRGEDVGTTTAVGMASSEHILSSSGRLSPFNNKLGHEGKKDLTRFESSISWNESFGGKSKESEYEQKLQGMQKRFNEEKRDILNRASRENAKLEDEVREAKEKLTSYRRSLEDEIDDLKRKHRKEIDYLNDKLSKERAEYEEKLHIAERNISKAMVGTSTTQRNPNNHNQESMMRRDERQFELDLGYKNGSKATFRMSGDQRDRSGFDGYNNIRKEETTFQEELGNRNGFSVSDMMSVTARGQYGFEDDNRVGIGRITLDDNLGIGGQMFQGDPENQSSRFKGETRESQSQLQNEKRKLMETIHALTKEVNALKSEKREMKNCYKKEIEKMTKIHDLEKTTIRERAARDKDDDVSRIKEDYEGKLASERKRLQGIIDEFRRKMSLTERKVKDMEVQQKNEIKRHQEEKRNAERSLSQSQDELKKKLEQEYSKMLSGEKHKFEQTIKGLAKQISFLQDQRKEIQEKLRKSELLADTGAKTEQMVRNRMVIQMEQEFFERVEREKRPMEDKIKDLQQEINKVKREKSELRGILENEKQELEDELEKMQNEMQRKLSKVREEMERKTDIKGKHMMAATIKNVLVGSDTCHQCAQSDVRQYKEQMNLMEQRNMTLQTKTERLERELRVMGDRLKTLQARNKNLEAVNREELSIKRNDARRSSFGYNGESDIREPNDLSIGSMIGGLRTETRTFQSNLFPRLNPTSGQSLMGLGQSYGDILDKVRYTMHATASTSDVLRGPMAQSSGMFDGRFLGGTSVGLRQSEPMTADLFNQTMTSSLGAQNVADSSSLGNTRLAMRSTGENFTTEGVGDVPLGDERNHQPAVL